MSRVRALFPVTHFDVRRLLRLRDYPLCVRRFVVDAFGTTREGNHHMKTALEKFIPHIDHRAESTLR